MSLSKKNGKAIQEFYDQIEDGERIELSFIHPAGMAKNLLAWVENQTRMPKQHAAAFDFLKKVKENPGKIRCSCCNVRFEELSPTAFVTAGVADEKKAEATPRMIVVGICIDCYRNRPDWEAEAEAKFDRLFSNTEDAPPMPTVSGVGHA